MLEHQGVHTIEADHAAAIELLETSGHSQGCSVPFTIRWQKPLQHSLLLWQIVLYNIDDISTFIVSY